MLEASLTFNFNPRSHERSDALARCLLSLVYGISIHAPTRGATIKRVTLIVIISFQSTLPREERRCFIIIRDCFNIFQSTLPREERPMQATASSRIWSFQSTLPREERHKAHWAYKVIGLYFNPRSHERSDVKILSIAINLMYFNPRSHERSDNKRMPVSSYYLISIHAPTRGATNQRF